jgi:MFS transporter, OPA family, glycerol-3-phosphate transporter
MARKARAIFGTTMGGTLRKTAAPDAKQRRRWLVIAALYAAYASFYLCRANVDASLPLLSAAFGYDKESLGRLASLAILCYALGKVLLGPLGDSIGGRRLLAISIGGSVVASLGFGFSTSLLLFTFFAGLNRGLQAGGWVGVVHVASSELAPAERGSVMGVVSTSFEVGNVLSLLLCGALVAAGFTWRTLFVVNPVLFAVIGGTAIVLLHRTSRAASDRAATHVGDASEDRATREEVSTEQRTSRRLAWLVAQKSFWIAIALSFLLTMVRAGFATWIPMFLAELAQRRGGTMSSALVKSALFPAAGLVGALTAGRVSDAFGPGRRAPVIAVSLALLVASMLLLAHGGIDDAATALVAIVACGLFLLGPYSLVGGAIVLDVGAGRAAGTAAGLIDAGGYVGAALGGALLGILAQRRGWSAAFDALAVAAFLACAVATWWALGHTTPVPSRETA